MEHIQVKAVRYISDITGPDYTGKWDVDGTDLGIPVYSARYQRMVFLFGDTFSNPDVAVNHTGGRNWRGTVAGYTDDFDLSDGVRWKGFFSDEEGNARALIRAHHSANNENIEVTKISQGGIEVDGKLYVFYESIRHWGPTGSGFWDINYSGAIRSTDGGKTFTRVNDLSWCETDEGEYAPLIKKLAEEDMNLQPSGFDLDLSSHVAPGFGQMFALDGKDGFIYIYGRHGGRMQGIKVGRVRKQYIEQFSEYEYLVNRNENGAVWLKGKAGLDVLREKDDACDIIEKRTSNMAVSYNSYLGKWILTFIRARLPTGCAAEMKHP